MLDFITKDINHLPTYLILVIVMLHFMVTLITKIFEFVGKQRSSDPTTMVYEKLTEVSIDIKQIQIDLKNLENNFALHVESDTKFASEILGKLN